MLHTVQDIAVRPDLDHFMHEVLRLAVPVGQGLGPSQRRSTTRELA